MKKQLFILSQYLLPHHLLSRLAGCIAECRVRWFKNAFTAWFAKRYQVDMSQALVEDLTAYEHFNAFFTRALKDGARPLDETPGAVLSPADGAVSQLGPIEHGRVFQAKGHSFSVLELLGGDAALAAPFMGGDFATIYLSPKDYHRVHMPLAGTLREMVYVPGRIFSVNQTTAENVPELFARNERVVCLFDTERGPMAVVLVGAMIVASIETVWAGLVTPPKRELKTFRYDEAARAPIHLEKGAELGRFKLGSTAIVLFGPDQVKWAEELVAGTPVQMGVELIAPFAQACGMQLTRAEQSSQFLRALLLPEVRAIDGPATVIAPRLPVEDGSKVRINTSGEQRRASLSNRRATTGSYNQFEYQIIEGPKKAAAPDGGGPEQEFDSLWTVL